jgi:hypothetical protein
MSGTENLGHLSQGMTGETRRKVAIHEVTKMWGDQQHEKRGQGAPELNASDAAVLRGDSVENDSRVRRLCH